MIAYRAEIWCDGERCHAGYGEGIAHGDAASLPMLSLNREWILLDAGWTIEVNKHYCPKCSRLRAKAKARGAE